MKFLKLIIPVAITLITTSVFAGGNTCESQDSGNWSDAATWINCGETIPQNSDDVIIKNGHTISLDTDTNQLTSLTVEVGGDFNVAANPNGTSYTLSGNSFTTFTFDLSNAVVNLSENFIIEADAKDIVIGEITGNFDLTINSSQQTTFTGTNSSTTNVLLKSITTNTAGTNVFKGIWNFTLTGDTGSVFNDAIELGTSGNIKGELSFELTGLGGLIFQKSISSIANREHVLQLTSSTGEFTFNDTVSVGNITTNGSANSIMNGLQMFASNGEYNTGVMLFNGPVIIADDMEFKSVGNSGDITFNNTMNDDGNSNTDADVTINNSNETNFSDVIGGINSISSLTTDTGGQTNLHADINVIDGVFLGDTTNSLNSLSINANTIQISNDLAISGTDFTFNCGSVLVNKIDGVISGSGDFIKDGVGDLEVASINTLTGNLIINDGTVTNTNASENTFPSVSTFSLASGTQASLSSATTDKFVMNSSQDIIGSGYMSHTIDPINDAIIDISPGFSPGQLTFDKLYIDEFTSITIEIDGLTAGTDYDQIIILDRIELEYDLNNGASLNVSLGYTPTVGDVYTIIDNQGIDPINDQFINLVEGDSIIIGNVTLVISYIGGDGNDVTLTVTSAPKTIYVDKDAANGGDGTSWATAYNSLHDGLNAAADGDAVWVADGIYKPDVNGGDLLTTFALNTGVKLYGGFNGTETNISEQDPAANLTIISGDLDGDDNVAANGITERAEDLIGLNSFHLITTTGSDFNTLIDGFTLTGGWANGMVTNDQIGSAILCIGTSSLTLNNITLQGNRSENRNAIRNCELDVTNSSFINNYTPAVGAITSEPASFTDVIFKGNVANGQGSLIYMQDGYVNMNRVKIMGNGNGNASVIRALHVTLNFNDVLISGNIVTKGVLDALGSTNGILNNLTVVGNLNPNSGSGGINAAIRSNITGVNPLEINNSIFWNNQDESGLGSVNASIVNLNTGTVTINSSLIQGTGGSGAWIPTTLTDLGGNLDTNPLLVMITNPSSAPTTAGDAHLTELSMAIDTGDNSVVTSTTDLNNRARIVNTTVDMGAYEYFVEEVFKDGFE